MIDLTGFPFPPNAPEPGECVRIERPEAHVAVVYLDPPHRKLTVLDAPLLRDLDAAITELEADTSLQALVLTGKDATQFAAGADVEAIGSIDDPAAVAAAIRAVHELFRRIENLRARKVAAVAGAVPGGAFEISLTCDYIVATDDARTRIGLPETMLGIIPAWGGSHRLPKRVGVPKALEAILTGRLFPAKKASKLGLIDRLTKPEYLLRVALDIATGRMQCKRAERGWKRWAIDRNPLALKLIESRTLKQLMAKTKGHYPAPLRALGIVLEAPATSLSDGIEKEAQAGSELATGPVAKSLISIFFASEAAKKLGRGSGPARPRRIERATVVGAGVMGAGVASLLATKGVAVRLMDLSRPALDQALLGHAALVAKQKKRRRFAPHEANAALDRLDGTTSLEGMGRSQIVIEAAAEKLEIKRNIFGDLARQLEPDAILATNTSSLSVDAIAEGLPHPERVCGMHFFNPVPKMPLVEVIRGSQTSDSVVTEVAALALRMGKTPVVVKDVAGFLVNRILGPYLDEAMRLFQGGVDPQRMERLLEDFGMPMGPLKLLDEVGLDIATHAAAALFEAYGDRMAHSDGIELLVTPERLGKKTGRGFYVHPSGKRGGKALLAPDLSQYAREGFARDFSDQQVIDRLILSMVNEAARCLEEDVVAGPVELDLATVFGMGFAPFRGGLMRYADGIGAQELVERLRRIAAADDVVGRVGGVEKFTPTEYLLELAQRGETFHGAQADRQASLDKAG